MLNTILVAVDGSEPSEKALSFALGLAVAQNAQLWLCHVPVRSKVNEIGARIPFSRDAAQWQWDDALSAGRSILDAARERAQEFGVPTKTALGAGSPSDAIVQFAERESADIIVMGSNGSDAVIRRAPVPVVVVGPDASWFDELEPSPYV
ncbi:MAG TPA: universal stress protein [Candidatus Baltobacteraceae bacterium]|nr:universal stress protein [Candidatus Baltobacteraceae bacterium]